MFFSSSTPRSSFPFHFPLYQSCHSYSSISDDDEVPPLSSKYGDVYSLNGYEDNVSATVNGLHGDFNGEGDTKALKPGVSTPAAVCWASLVVNFPAKFLDDEPAVCYD